jgi:AbrB family looped-hinge helix DNA binding protein
MAVFMEQKHTFMTGTLRVGKKGQITLPKKIRDEDECKNGDRLTYTHMPNGETILKKQEIDDPIQRAFAIIKDAPKIDWRKAWNEVRDERKRDR